MYHENKERLKPQKGNNIWKKYLILDDIIKTFEINHENDVLHRKEQSENYLQHSLLNSNCNCAQMNIFRFINLE